MPQKCLFFLRVYISINKELILAIHLLLFTGMFITFLIMEHNISIAAFLFLTGKKQSHYPGGCKYYFCPLVIQSIGMSVCKYFSLWLVVCLVLWSALGFNNLKGKHLYLHIHLSISNSNHIASSQGICSCLNWSTHYNIKQ